MKQRKYSGVAPARHSAKRHSANSHPTPTVCPDCLIDLELFDEIAEEAFTQRDKHGTGNAYHALKREFHKAILPRFLDLTAGNRTDAAQLLGINRSTLSTYLHQIDAVSPESVRHE